MAITREKKKEVVKATKEKLEKAKVVVFFDAAAITHKELEKARKEMRKIAGEISVVKKSLLKIAAKDAEIGDIDMKENCPTAFAFGYNEETLVPQLIYKFVKETKKFAILGGIIEGKIVDKETMLMLAKLPSREELLAKLIAVIQSPISSLISDIQEIPGRLIRIIEILRSKAA